MLSIYFSFSCIWHQFPATVWRFVEVKRISWVPMNQYPTKKYVLFLIEWKLILTANQWKVCFILFILDLGKQIHRARKQCWLSTRLYLTLSTGQAYCCMVERAPRCYTGCPCFTSVRTPALMQPFSRSWTLDQNPGLLISNAFLLSYFWLG